MLHDRASSRSLILLTRSIRLCRGFGSCGGGLARVRDLRRQPHGTHFKPHGAPPPHPFSMSASCIAPEGISFIHLLIRTGGTEDEMSRSSYLYHADSPPCLALTGGAARPEHEQIMIMPTVFPATERSFLFFFSADSRRLLRCPFALHRCPLSARLTVLYDGVNAFRPSARLIPAKRARETTPEKRPM